MRLSNIPAKYFEVAGTIAGLLTSVIISIQIYVEYNSDNPSTISPAYALGFMLNFLFWMFYGIRFGRVALWLTNSIAVCVQALLLILILSK